MQFLYKKDSKGKIRVWSAIGDHDQLIVHSGLLEGKKVSQSKTVVPKGNKTLMQQMNSELNSAYQKQLKSGYVDSLEKAQAGKLDEVILGGELPMLAETLGDPHKLKFPVYVQPKLDGHRCIAIKVGDEITLWSRTRKPILSCPHIIQELKHLLSGCGNVSLDGELYIHDKVSFEKLSGAIRKKVPTEESSHIQYHIYDVVRSDITFYNRLGFISSLEHVTIAQPHIEFVHTEYVGCVGDLRIAYRNYMMQKYEGLMIRYPDSYYEHKRSGNLIKMKEMLDDEFRIINISAGEMDTVVMTVLLPNGKFNDANMSGPRKENQKYLDNPKKYIGKQLTVQYQGFTDEGKLRFPVGLRIRQDI